jgi:hypothetical protein
MGEINKSVGRVTNTEKRGSIPLIVAPSVHKITPKRVHSTAKVRAQPRDSRLLSGQV